MRICAFLLALAAPMVAYSADSPPWATKDLRAGIIGTDTSHVPAFTELFRSHPEWKIRVTAAFKAGSPDLPTSATRVEAFAKTIHDKYDVELVGSIEELLPKVDVVLLESVDGRTHLAQATPVLKAGKPLFIDKPLAASLDDARRIIELARETKTPFFTSSAMRFHPDIPKLRKDPGVGKVVKVQANYTLNKLDFHPDLYFYGIHGVEPLFAVMGPGCVSVTRKVDHDADITTGQWADGRIGVYNGILNKEKAPLVRIWGSEGTAGTVGTEDYKGLVRAIAEFFQTGRSPVDTAETIEIFEFMTAAQLSKERGGAEVPLAELRK